MCEFVDPPFTVTVHVAFFAFAQYLASAVIVAFPSPLAVTKPFELTVATVLFEVLQLIVASLGLRLSPVVELISSIAVALNCIVEPTVVWAVLLFNVTSVTGTV